MLLAYNFYIAYRTRKTNLVDRLLRRLDYEVKEGS
jgi:hypothetical protein